ncbi:TolC family protein [Coraliomargarita akajimensis]|uniref:Outer membrane efflux protein n=1 Tax=Coraliomargarita akajimensis (strain DSM 45221 / IAM 15411 / JCM 23193 / KCTC 12865 / 04OKA010-24) TaxID=583355 RepID=D5EL83_CORAD|nr:TolC family protein [Coraliomargarita akajimensis]ADE53185.1 outer membrane efflux protein [Coraliomargarita akajimensis DSM 45221]
MRSIHYITTFLLSVSAVFAETAKAEEPMPIPEEVYLQDAIDFALENSLSILQAKERIEEQYGLIAEVRSNVLPTISLNSSISEQDEELAGPYSTADNWSVSLQVRQAIYGGGALSAGLRSQKALEKAALYELQAVVEMTIQEVKTRYYDVLLQRDRIEVEEQNIELLEEQLENTQSRFDAGSVSNFDVLQSQVSLANAKPALIRARNNFRVAVAELKRSIGYVKTSDHVTKTPTFMGELDVMIRDYDLLSSITQALQQRPELAQQELIIESSKEGIDVARAGYRPTLDLVGSYSYRRSYETIDDRFDNPEGGWYVGLESTWNIWDGRATRGRVVQARSQVRQAELSLTESKLAVELEVRRAVSELQGSAELVEAARQVTEQAEEALRLANERYGVGSSTLLDTLQARVSLTEARNNQLQANYSYLVSQVNMERALGVTEYNFVDEE